MAIEMTPKVTLEKVDILEAETRLYKGKDGSDKTFRAVIFRFSGKIMKLPLAKDAVSDSFKVTTKPVGLVCSLSTFGDSLEPSLRAESVE